MKFARIAFLEFFGLLITLPLQDVNAILGGQAGVAMLLILWDSLVGDGKPEQHNNNRNLN